ncbi:protein O-glucosyltransferase 2-like [Ylistrum balloti]|uniref:protein O-glucosyltransferase 2-like n=1 Tax=Ylistrum balloti TaxID=509963 RepID=UPI0029059344|nr:protein O-glucosyltransferase 2-like [Ylistrum balloti]
MFLHCVAINSLVFSGKIKSLTWIFLVLVQTMVLSSAATSESVPVDISKTMVWGPGLNSRLVLPVRYFFIQVVDENGSNVTRSIGEKAFEVAVSESNGDRVRAWVQVLDANDGTYIGRFRLIKSYQDLKINIKYKNKHVPGSPYLLKGIVYNEECYCPVASLDKWFEVMGCKKSYSQIDEDFLPFPKINTERVAQEAISRFSQAGMHSLSRYRIIDNKIYRKTYGEHVGFKMFSDAVLLSITRKVRLPDMEFFINLGDWPLEKKSASDSPLPIISWCGSADSRDIVLPTYDITEATLEMMSRVTLDVLSVQGNTGVTWVNKTNQAFWRGRDSRQERLNLVQLSRRKPHLLDAALTHMFFFSKDENKYGPLVKTVPFFEFFKYKYQINIDGTVAAYRLPYLLAGDSLVMKHESNYYEHFYRDLVPWQHYVPFQLDLGDLERRILWAKKNDDEAKKISVNARQFVRDNIMPRDILCYHGKVFKEYAKRQMKAPKEADNTWDVVDQPASNCDCKRLKPVKKSKEEL